MLREYHGVENMTQRRRGEQCKLRESCRIIVPLKAPESEAKQEG